MPAGTVIPKEPFKDTLVTVYNITRPDIIDVRQLSGIRGRRRLSGSGRRLSTTEDVTMTYRLAAADGAQAAALEEVAQELAKSSAARESFTTTLVTNAADLNSDNFDPVALAAAEVSAMNLHVGDRRYGDDDGLSGGAIAGIVIGVLCGVALLVGAVVFSMKKGDTTPKKHKDIGTASPENRGLGTSYAARRDP